MTPKHIKIRLHLNIFGYTLLVLSYGWMMMSALQGQLLDIYQQMLIIFISAVLWTLFGELAIFFAKKIFMKALLEQKEQKINEASSGE